MTSQMPRLPQSAQQLLYSLVLETLSVSHKSITEYYVPRAQPFVFPGYACAHLCGPAR